MKGGGNGEWLNGYGASVLRTVHLKLVKMANFMYIYNLENKFKKRRNVTRNQVIYNCSTQDNRRKYMIYHYMKATTRSCSSEEETALEVRLYSGRIYENCVLKVPSYTPIRETE